MTKNNIKINIVETLKYFDERNDDNKKGMTSVINFCGEDIAAGLFKHYLQKFKNKNADYLDVQIINDSPKFGKAKGPRLDVWIQTRKYLFQTEIKNWAVRAIGGNELKIDAGDNHVEEYAGRSFNRQWSRNFVDCVDKKVNKVMYPMKKPGHVSGEIQPLVIYWQTLKPKKEKDIFFNKIIKKYKTGWNREFKKVYFFSLSLYLRKLLRMGHKTVPIEAPEYIRKIGLLDQMFK